MVDFTLDSYHPLFIKSALDCINNLKTHLLSYQSSTTQDKHDKTVEMHRLAHMLKGQSAFMNYQNTAKFCLILERIFKSIKEKNATLNEDQLSQLTQTINLLQKNLHSIESEKKELNLIDSIKILGQTYKNQYENPNY